MIKSLVRRTAILNLICAMSSLGSAQSMSVGGSVSAPFSMVQPVTRVARFANLNNPRPTAGLPVGVSVPSNATVANNVQTNSSWGTCVGSCANMPAPKTYSMHQKVSSASINGDGTGATLYETGTSFGGIMWNNHLPSSTATHFVMDFYINVDHPENAQALEFAVLKMDGNHWFKFSTQCNYASGQVRGFNTKLKQWQNLGATCVPAKANTWQRVTVEYAIVNGSACFISIAFDGAVQPSTVQLPPELKSSSSQTFGMHFQLDNARTTTGYTVAIDNWSIYSW